MAGLLKTALAVLLYSCVVAGSFLPKRGCIDTTAATGWTERQPGQRWSPGTGECLELTCHPDGAVTVTGCHVGTPPPGCTMEAAKKDAAFPGCCPRVRCPPATSKAKTRKDSRNSLATPSFSVLGGLGVVTSYYAPLPRPANALLDGLDDVPTPALWLLSQLLDADHAWTTKTVPKPEKTEIRDRVAAQESPVVVAGKPITGEALRFYNKFMRRMSAAPKSSSAAPKSSSAAPKSSAGPPSSRARQVDGILPGGEMLPFDEMLLSYDGVLPFEDDVLLDGLLLDGLPRDEDNELQVENPTVASASTHQKQKL